MSVKDIFIDFETYSERDITEIGGWAYSEDPKLDILCLAWAIGDGPVHIYRPYEGDDLPYELFDAIEDGHFLNAWNVSFEYSIWVNHCIPKLGWPDVPTISWFDSAAKSAAHGLPLGLDNACKVLGLDDAVAKSAAGKALIKLLCVPQKNGQRISHIMAPADYRRLYAYCQQDVVAERHISNMLGDLRPHERDFWLIDQLINRRGIPIDLESAHKIRTRVAQEMQKANDKLPVLSGGLITKVSQTKRIKDFAISSGIRIEDCQADTVEKVLTFAEKNPHLVKEKHRAALEILDIRRWFGKAAVSKYDKFINCAASDGRVHYTMVYSGAHTGRWVGRLIQPHNLFKATIHYACDVNDFVDAVANRPISCVEAVYQPYIHAAASATRMMIAAPKYKTFFIGDYNAIEARYAFWLAGDEQGLNYYKQGLDPYCEMGSKIFGFTVTKKNTFERFVGKGIVLGAIFGLGADGFVRTMKVQWGVDIDPNIAERGISTFRATHKMVKQLWNKLNEICISAVNNPGTVYTYRYLKAYKPADKPFLFVMLPSKRLIAYPFPKVAPHKTPWGEVKDALSFKTWDNNGWFRVSTHGGVLTENVVQGGSRDVMADGMIKLEFNNHPIVFTVHDELIAEISEENKIDESNRIHQLLETPPDWAHGLPLKVEYEISRRYKK